MRRPDIPVLTTLRFPAAFAIVLYHFLPYTTCPSWVWGGFSEGVSFFYVLSGFILYYNYLDMTDRGFFWVARLSRIWPVHLVTCLMALLLLPWENLLGHASWQITLPANLLLVQAWLPFKGSTLSFNGVSWSLSVEGFFYLCFPWLLGLLKRRRSSFVLAAAFGLGFLIVSLATIFWPANASIVGSFNPACRLFEFVLGMTTCKFWLEGKEQATNVSAWLGYEALVLSMGLVLVVSLPLIIGALGMVNPAVNWLGSTICAFGFAGLIWVLAHQAGPISRMLSQRYLTWLGEISFAVYMCHQIILRRMGVDDLLDPARAWWKFAIYALVTLIASAAIFHLVETPSRHALVSAYKRWSARRNPN
jgi:peptidoglycan/LPS O-acetylase OafA/YrhL